MTRRAVEWTAGAVVVVTVSVVAWRRLPVDAPAVEPAAPTRPVVATQPDTRPVLDPFAADIKRLGSIDDGPAAGRLVDAGESALSALQKLADDPTADPQSRTRAAALIADIANHLADDPSTVTLHVDHAPASSVFRALPGHDRIDGVPPATFVTLSVDNGPFWPVFSDLCRQTKLAPLPDGDPTRGLSLAKSDVPWLTDAPHQVSGPFWIGVLGLSRSSAVDYQVGKSPPPTASARLVVLPEPKLNVFHLSDFVPDRIEDEAGNSMVVPPSSHVDLTSATEIRVPLKLHDPPGKRIATFAGSVFITLAQGMIPLRIDDLMSGVKSVDAVRGCVIKVRATRRSGDLFAVDLTADRVWLPEPQWQGIVASVRSIAVLDANGIALQNVQWTPEADTSPVWLHQTGLFTTTLYGDSPKPAGPPASIRWDVPSRFKTVRVPVELHDLPVP